MKEEMAEVNPRDPRAEDRADTPRPRVRAAETRGRARFGQISKSRIR